MCWSPHGYLIHFKSLHYGGEPLKGSKMENLEMIKKVVSLKEAKKRFKEKLVSEIRQKDRPKLMTKMSLTDSDNSENDEFKDSDDIGYKAINQRKATISNPLSNDIVDINSTERFEDASGHPNLLSWALNTNKSESKFGKHGKIDQSSFPLSRSIGDFSTLQKHNLGGSNGDFGNKNNIDYDEHRLKASKSSKMPFSKIQTKDQTDQFDIKNQITIYG